MRFSPDGAHLAIGGGAWYGGGGVMIVEHASGRSELLASRDLPLETNNPIGPTVSGVCFSADGRHLVASAWTSSHCGGQVILFEAAGTELHYRDGFRIAYSEDNRSYGMATGIFLHAGQALVRNYGTTTAQMITSLALPETVDRGPLKQVGSQRLVVVGDRVITGNQGEFPRDPRSSEGRLIAMPLAELGHGETPWGTFERIEVADGSRISAIACAGDRVISGGHGGELDAWSLGGSWRQQRLRAATRYGEPSFPGLDVTWAHYTPNSIVDICAIPGGAGADAASISASGELCLFDTIARFEAHQLGEPGTPRSLAAHPDGAALAVGIKQGGFGKARGAVVIVDLRAPIDPAWCTPAVHSLAVAAAKGDANAFAVLADALEEAGSTQAICSHVRHHDPALPACWVVDAILGA